MKDLDSSDRAERIRLKLMPGWGQGGLGWRARRALRRLPPEVQELALVARGFSIGFDEVIFMGGDGGEIGLDGLVEGATALTHSNPPDESYVEVDPRTGQWGFVIRLCHSPFGIAVEGEHLARWLQTLFDAHRAAVLEPDDLEFEGYDAMVRAARFPQPTDCLIGTAGLLLGDEEFPLEQPAEPIVVPVAGGMLLDPQAYRRLPTAGRPADPHDRLLRTFCASLPPDAVVFDLRRVRPGDYARLGELDARTTYRRAGQELLFAAVPADATGRSRTRRV